MEFKTYQNRLRQLSARFNLMVFLVFGLLIANVLLSSFIWKAWQRHSVEITPFIGGPSYIKSYAQVDGHYLSLMSENFIYSRLNVTPETVKANHQRILMFADSQRYPEMLKVLNQEAAVIISKKMSSHFEITSIRTNPTALTAEVSGVLKRFVGIRALKEERMNYALRFNYAEGQLSIINFTHLKEESHA
jgi:conjugal transfer pilus assembly protein TraE